MSPTLARKEKEEEKAARLDFRLPHSAKETIGHAASLLGVTMSDFVASAAVREALNIIKQREIIQLNREEAQRFVDSLLDPPEPNEALTRLMRRDV